MAIILWALYPLSPWRRLQESARYLLDVLVRNIQDQRTIDWLCAYPDDPRGIPHFEAMVQWARGFARSSAGAGDPWRVTGLVRSPHIQADYHLQLTPGTNVAMIKIDPVDRVAACFR